MVIYLVQLAIILLLSLVFHPESSDKGKRWFVFLSFILLTFVSGMRGFSVGVDTHSYVSYFLRAGNYTLTNTRFEAGFVIYLKILRFFTNEPGVLLFISSIICVGSVCYFIYKFSKKPAVSLLLYIMLGQYFSQMNIMRQALAVSFSMFAFALVLNESVEKKYKIPRIIASVVLLIIAQSFHNMAIVLFVPWIILIRKSGKENEYKHTIQHTVLITILIAVATFFGYTLFLQLSSLVFSRYTDFYYSSEWGQANYFGSLFNALISVAFMLVGAVALRGRILTKMQRFAAIMLGFNVIFIVLSMRMEVWGRVASSFGVYTALIWVPEFLDVIENRNNLIIVEGTVMAGSFLYMMVILIYRPEWWGVVPYVIG